MDFTVIMQNKDVILNGLLTTLQLYSVSSILGLIMTIAITFIYIESNHYVKKEIQNLIIKPFTYTPLYCQVLIILSIGTIDYIADSQLSSLFYNGTYIFIAVLVLNTTAYASSIFIQEIENLDKNYSQLSNIYNLSTFSKWKEIYFKSTYKKIMPQYMNENLYILYGTPLALVVGTEDLYNITNNIANKNANELQMIVLCLLIYAVISLSIMATFKLIEKFIERRTC